VLTQGLTRVGAVVVGLAALGTTALMSIQATSGWGRQQATGSEAAGALERQAVAPGQVAAESLVKTFYVRSHGGKCLDFGAPPQVSGSPVFLYGCNGKIAQHVRIEELSGPGHLVILRAGTKVIGVKPEAERPLPPY